MNHNHITPTYPWYNPSRISAWRSTGEGKEIAQVLIKNRPLIDTALFDIEFSAEEVNGAGDEVIGGEIVDDKLIDDEVIDDEMVDGKLIDDEVIGDEMVDGKLIDDEVIDDEMADGKLINDEVIDEEDIIIEIIATKNSVAEESIAKESTAEESTTLDVIETFLKCDNLRIVADEKGAIRGEVTIEVELEDIDDLVTEELAEIYIAQGLIEEGKSIYIKLSLLNSEKSVYFAELIENIDKNQVIE